MDAAPAKFTAPSTDKTKHVHEALGLAGTKDRGGPNVSPKRVRTGEDQHRKKEDGMKGKLPVINGREWDTPGGTRAGMKVKPVSSRFDVTVDRS